MWLAHLISLLFFADALLCAFHTNICETQKNIINEPMSQPSAETQKWFNGFSALMFACTDLIAIYFRILVRGNLCVSRVKWSKQNRKQKNSKQQRKSPTTSDVLLGATLPLIFCFRQIMPSPPPMTQPTRK